MRAPVPAIPRATVRELDRLSRAAHRFHRFAHHPLCSDYASEVIRIGRKTRLCRGCTLAALGALAGIVAATAGRAAPLELGVLATGAGALVVASALAVRSFRADPRAKWVTRALPCAALAFGAASGLRVGGELGGLLACAAALVFMGSASLYRARGPDRSPCATCPERSMPEPCRGLAPIVRRERAFQRRARSILDPIQRPRSVTSC